MKNTILDVWWIVSIAIFNETDNKLEKNYLSEN